MVKALVEAGKVRTTHSARAGANELGFAFSDMLGVVMALTQADFYKSMTTHADHAVWQDVYRPSTQAGDVYLKLTVINDVLIVSSRSYNMKCPVCGAAELIHDTRDLPYTYKGENTVIVAVTGDFCPACAESILDAAESNRVMREMRAFSKQVNAAIVDPVFITNVRKKLDLDQREAAEIFGGGINAFSRYENGKTKPPLALVKLFKLLDRHPDLLNEVRAA